VKVHREVELHLGAGTWVTEEDAMDAIEAMSKRSSGVTHDTTEAK